MVNSQKNEDFNSKVRLSLARLLINDRIEDLYYTKFFENPLTPITKTDTEIKDPLNFFKINDLMPIEQEIDYIKDQKDILFPKLLEPSREKHELFKDFALFYGFGKPITKKKAVQVDIPSTSSGVQPLNGRRSRQPSTSKRPKNPVNNNNVGECRNFCSYCYDKKVQMNNENRLSSPQRNDPNAPWNNHGTYKNGRITCPNLYFNGCPKCGANLESCHMASQCPFN